MVVQLPSSQVQQNFGAAMDRTLRGEDVIIERYGLPRAVLVEYERYQALAAAERQVGQLRDAHPVEPVPVPPAQLGEATAIYLVERDQAQTPHDRLTRQAVMPEAAGDSATAYRYVVAAPGICGGQPTIRGTRVPVRTIVGYHKLGLSVDEILAGLPHLTPAQVYEALSYYYDHADEIEAAIQENQLPQLIERYGLQLAADGRITVAS